MLSVNKRIKKDAKEFFIKLCNDHDFTTKHVSDVTNLYMDVCKNHIFRAATKKAIYLLCFNKIYKDKAGIELTINACKNYGVERNVLCHARDKYKSIIHQQVYFKKLLSVVYTVKYHSFFNIDNRDVLSIVINFL